MAKDTFYFTHDFNSRNDPKMIRLVMKTGIIGVGIYWCLIEMLYEQGGTLSKHECERIAFELRTDSDLVQSVIDTDLFAKNEEKFWSESVLRRLKERKDKSIKARESAMVRWHHANALQPQSKGYAIKERKGNV